MINRLTPEQISKFWDVIKFAVEQSLPPTVGEHPDKMNRILAAALSGKIDVWASYTKNEKVNKFEGIILTKFLYDDVSGTRNLLIYCLYGYNKFESISWKIGLETFAKYAKSRGCSRIIAYTDIPHIVDIVNKLGGEAKYTFISFDVNKVVQNLNNLVEE